MEKFPVVNAIITGVKMSQLAKDTGLSQPMMSYRLKEELDALANCPANIADAEIMEALSVRNAYTVRRNPRAFARAMSNTIAAPRAKSVQHILAAPTLEQAIDLVMSHDFINKAAAITIIQATLQNEYKIEKL
jgi:hypothetical protein